MTTSRLISGLCYAKRGRAAAMLLEGGADLTGMHSFGNSVGFIGDFRKTCKFSLQMKVVLDMCCTVSQSRLYFCPYLLATVKEQSLAGYEKAESLFQERFKCESMCHLLCYLLFGCDLGTGVAHRCSVLGLTRNLEQVPVLPSLGSDLGAP